MNTRLVDGVHNSVCHPGHSSRPDDLRCIVLPVRDVLFISFFTTSHRTFYGQPKRYSNNQMKDTSLNKLKIKTTSNNKEAWEYFSATEEPRAVLFD